MFVTSEAVLSTLCLAWIVTSLLRLTGTSQSDQPSHSSGSRKAMQCAARETGLALASS